MIKNYFVTTIRNLFRNRFLSVINIIGLALGVASATHIYQYVFWEKSYDDFHEEAENIYRVSQLFLKEGELDFHAGATFATVGPALKEDFPQVRDYCRLLRKWRGGVVTYEDISFMEHDLIYADPSFFQIFSFPLLTGNPEEVLSKPNTAVIDQETAIKYFGEESPVGKRISIGSMNGTEEYEISGVFKSTKNSHLSANLLLSYKSAVQVFGPEVERSWGWWDFHTYILLEKDAEASLLEAEFPAFADKYGGERRGRNRVGFKLQPLTGIHLESHLRHELGENGDGQMVNFLSMIGVFIIVIAWMNYINLVTARSIHRAKEVGIRKVMGSHISQLILQFLLESFLMNLVAIILGLALVYLTSTWFYELTGQVIPFGFLNQPISWYLLGAMWIVGSLVSGIYPAVAISSQKPIRVLRSGSSVAQGKATLRQTLVIFQFIASSSLIAGTLVVYSQLHYMQSQDKGIDISHVIAITAPDVINDRNQYHQQLSTYKDLLEQHNAVTKVGISSDIPGEQVGWMGSSSRIGGQEQNLGTIIFKHTLDNDYLALYGNEFLAGRNFEKPSDSIYVILNKAALSAFGFLTPQDAINERVTISGVDTLTIIGVIDDFHQETLKSRFRPTAYLYIDQESRYFSVKVNSEENDNFLAYAQDRFEDIFPEGVFEHTVVEEHVADQYQSEDSFLSTFLVFAGLAITIALLGLIGLTYYATEQRRKEIGIRKVLGSSVPNIFLLLSGGIVRQIFVANLFAAPLIVYYAGQWLEGFAFRTSFNYLFLLATLGITLVLSMLIVCYHIINAATDNPVKVLRLE